MKIRASQSCGRSGVLVLVSVLAVGLLTVSAASAGQTETKQVNVDPGKTKEKNVGCGFGDLSDDVYELKIELTSEHEIVDSGIDEQAGDGVIWQQDGAVTKYKIAGVTPNKRFWVVIWAEIKPKGEGGEGGEAGKIIRWMSVSDVDADADTDNDSGANPRVPSESDDEDFAEYPGYQAPPTVPGLVIGVNDDHDEFLPDFDPWGRDLDNNTADLDKEGKNYDNQSVGLAQIKVKVGVKRAPGTLSFSIPNTIRLFEGEEPVAGNKGKAFLGDRRIETAGEKVFIFYAEGVAEDNMPAELTVTYTPEGGDGAAVDTISILPVRMDIDVDSNNDGTIDEADDLIEAKPDEFGMLLVATDDPEDLSSARPGVLRGLYSQGVTYLLADHSPVVTLKKLPSSTGNIRVWRVREGQDPVLMLDTSVGSGSTTEDGESGTLFELLGDASDHDILITGISHGEVLLGIELRVNGASVAMDAVKITVLHANIDVFRLEGTRVGAADEARQGTITKVFDPYSDADGEVADYPNHRVAAELSWWMPAGCPVTYKLEDAGPLCGGKGTIRIYDQYELIKDADESEVAVPIGEWTSPKILQTEGATTGVVNLRLAVRHTNGTLIGYDQVRVSVSPEMPQTGRILFVNPDATGGESPYDDYEENAAPTIADAILALSPYDNILVAPARYYETGLAPEYTCLIAGLGGNPSGDVDTVCFDLTDAPVISAQANGRVFLITSDISAAITISGLVITDGMDDTGGGILCDSPYADIRISYCAFVGCTATGEMPLPEFGEEYDLAGYPDSGDDGEDQLSGGEQVDSSSRASAAISLIRALSEEGSSRGGGAASKRVVLPGPPSQATSFMRTTFTGNTAQAYGGAVAIQRNEDPGKLAANLTAVPNALATGQTLFPRYILPEAFFHRCVFQSNSATSGGAIASTLKDLSDKPWKRMTGGAPFYASLTDFISNTATGSGRNRGGAIFLWGANCTGSRLRGCTLKENSATGPGAGNGDGGAAAVLFMATLTISDYEGTRSVIQQNTANDGGGGLYVTYFAVVRATDTDFTSNTSSGGAGAAHVTSGSVLDLVNCIVKSNSGVRGGAIHNRNSRVDIRNSDIIENTASQRGGGIYAYVCDDSGGQTWTGAWLYPESAVNPAITRIVSGSKINGNSAPIAGAVEAFRAGNANPSYVAVANKLLKLDIIDSTVADNTATANDASLGLVGGVALTGTDEAAGNRPQFNRAGYTTNLTNALSLTVYGVDRWSNGCGCTRAQAAQYITDIMLWGQTNAQLADDYVQNSLFQGNTNFQGSAAGGVMPAHLVKNGNTIQGAQNPAGLF